MKRARIKWYGNKAKAIVESACVSGVSEAAEYVLSKSNEVVPHDEGTLQGSGDIDIQKKPKPMASIYYDTPYARRHHEHPEYNFQKGRKGKYLEDTLNENTDILIEYLKSRLKF